MLDYDKYRDNNNFLEYNIAKLYVEKINVFKAPLEYKFLSLIQKPSWEGLPQVRIENLIDKEGNDLGVEEVENIFGMYFFFASTKNEYTKKIDTIWDLMSQCGGLYGIISFFSGCVVGFYNSRRLLAVLI